MKLKYSGHMIARLNSGESSSIPDKMVRSAILVHAGSFESKDGPIEFDEDRIKRVVENHNQMIAGMIKDYGGEDKTPIGAYPPILDSHSDDSNERVIGRLASLLRYERRDIPKVGKNIPCACADITFIGKKTCAMVIDGRIYHLSVGINEATDTLGETSTVVEPAAAGAMLLAKGKNKRGDKMNLKKLGAVLDKTKAASAKLLEAKKTFDLANRKGEVRSRLSSLMKSGKMTPAEFKKINLTKLSKLDAESLTIALSAFDAREERVIPAGQLGSTNAVNALDLAKAVKTQGETHMKAEFKAEAKRMGYKVRMSKAEEDAISKKMAEEPAKEEHKLEDAMAHEKKMSAYARCMEGMEAALEGGDMEAAKKHLEEMKKMEHYGLKHMAAPDMFHDGDEEKKAKEDMQRQIDELSVQVAAITSEIAHIVEAEIKEGHTDLAEKEKEEEEEKEEHKLEEEKKKDEDEKHLEDAEKKVDEKKLLEEAKKDMDLAEDKEEKEEKEEHLKK